MLRELDRVVLREERSLRSRILLWLYPNRGWIGASSAAGALPATRAIPRAAQSSSPRREEATHAV